MPVIVIFDRMPSETVRGFTQLVGGEIVLDDDRRGITQVRFPYTTQLPYSPTIEFYYEDFADRLYIFSDEYGEEREYWEIAGEYLGEAPIFESFLKRIKIFNRNSCAHKFVVLVEYAEYSPTAKEVHEIVELCLDMAERNVS